MYFRVNIEVKDMKKVLCNQVSWSVYYSVSRFVCKHIKSKRAVCKVGDYLQHGLWLFPKAFIACRIQTFLFFFSIIFTTLSLGSDLNKNDLWHSVLSIILGYLSLDFFLSNYFIILKLSFLRVISPIHISKITLSYTSNLQVYYKRIII